jgi:hypothetical protein
LKILITILILVISVTQTFSQYNSPESITYDSVGSRYFISNTSSSKIVQRDRQGVVTDFVTVGGSIHGVTVYGNKIFVCNGTRVKGYDLNSATEVMNVTISGSTFLNDLTADASGILYISDFSTRRIYKLNTSTQEYWIYVANTTNTPNGVYVDAIRNRLLICCWGSNAPVRQVNFADSVITTLITTPYSNCDGISLDRLDNVYISTWGIQSVVKYDINFVNPPVVVLNGLSNPADIYVNKITDTLAIPNAGNSTVVFSYLNTASSINQISGNLAETFNLKQNYPNPFNPTTNLEFGIANWGFVSINIFDVLGNKVANLVNTNLNQGSYKYVFNSTDLKSGVILHSGIYFYTLSVNGEIKDTKSMILLK